RRAAAWLATWAALAGVYLLLVDLVQLPELITGAVVAAVAATGSELVLAERRPARGRVRAIPFRHGGDSPDGVGRRALAEGLGSFAPNTIVIGVDDERNLLLVHQLVVTGEAGEALDPMELR